jgi:hypothetical protein
MIGIRRKPKSMAKHKYFLSADHQTFYKQIDSECWACSNDEWIRTESKPDDARELPENYRIQDGETPSYSEMLYYGKYPTGIKYRTLGDFQQTMQKQPNPKWSVGHWPRSHMLDTVKLTSEPSR